MRRTVVIKFGWAVCLATRPAFPQHKAFAVPDILTEPSAPAETSDRTTRLQHLEREIALAVRLLPEQGPITSFVALNTLPSFEPLPFDEGVQKACRIFGCQPYLSSDRYREELARGRILPGDLATVLRDDLGSRADEPVLEFGTRYNLRLAMLEYPLRSGPDAELRWFIAETDALRHIRSESPAATKSLLVGKTRHWIMRDVRNLARNPANGTNGANGTHGANGANGHANPDRQVHVVLADLIRHFGESEIESWDDETWEAFTLQVLWRLCRDGVQGVPNCTPPPPESPRHRDVLLKATHIDTDIQVHELLTRFCASFLDQGFSGWLLPNRDQGFYRSFSTLYQQPHGPPHAWRKGLPDELRRIDAAGGGALDSILESLDLLGVADKDWDEYLAATLVALRGWAGMVHQIENRSDSVAHTIPPGSLLEFLAVRLILERLALAQAAKEGLGFNGPLDQLWQAAKFGIARHQPHTVDQRAFQIFQLAQILGWLPDDLNRLTKPQWAQLVEEIEVFSLTERRRVFHRAYEHRFTTQALDAVSIQSRRDPARVSGARFQTIFCIDDREESFRRHLEEIAPDVETYSTAGFFGVAIYYKGTADAHFVPLCPIVIKPKHWVVENVVDGLELRDRQRAQARRMLGNAQHRFHVGSRGLAGGALLTAGLGLFASIPLLGRILFPRLAARIRNSASRLVRAPQLTDLQLERSDPTPGSEPGHVGYSLEEMTNIAEKVLREIGLIENFSRLVIALGHGSNSVNNPHKSAYDCGACGGGAGGPNARSYARFCNDPRVRAQLALRGLIIPPETVFVGGMHDTCSDTITLHDLDHVPDSHRHDLDEATKILEATCDRNAHERCRRFISAPLAMSFAGARRHVAGRAEDLAQTRPEYGHSSNAMCIVARRTRTKGLFLDRRSFLVSYDPHQDDPENTILARILAPAVPVCYGINLCYYFSYVDSAGWGSGTKLPHNITSMVGVMDGAASDLRTGLPWQGVEIHEPLRLLFLIETTPEIMLKLMERNPVIGNVTRQGWIQLALLDPDSSRIHIFRNGEFQVYEPQSKELPTAATSTDWYRGWRDHLSFAVIEKGG